MRAARWLMVVVAVLAALVSASVASVASASDGPQTRADGSRGCPRLDDPRDFASRAQLRRWSEKQESFGIRRPGWPGERGFINWLERRLEGTRGLRLQSIDHDLSQLDLANKEQVETNAGLVIDTPAAAPVRVAIAGPMPRTEATPPGGVTAPVVHLPAETPITPENSSGRIVFRDVTFRTIPTLFYYAQGYLYDPRGTVPPGSQFSP
ncbi:MAG TPA: hypothetical protein VEQ61_02520, partial [Thermoleophilaceae bacterium]|nr:hypothetical protein [Thermoleophilaceae bacterium]